MVCLIQTQMSGAVALCLACHAVMVNFGGELIVACRAQHVGSKHCSLVLTDVRTCLPWAEFHSIIVTAATASAIKPLSSVRITMA